MAIAPIGGAAGAEARSFKAAGADGRARPNTVWKPCAASLPCRPRATAGGRMPSAHDLARPAAAAARRHRRSRPRPARAAAAADGDRRRSRPHQGRARRSDRGARRRAPGAGARAAAGRELRRLPRGARSGVQRQHRVGVELRARRGERVLIAGGAGGMGGWFHAFFDLAGHHCDLLDPAFSGLAPRPGRYAALAEVPELDAYAAVLVAVPLARTAPVVTGVAATAAALADGRRPLIVRS